MLSPVARSRSCLGGAANTHPPIGRLDENQNEGGDSGNQRGPEAQQTRSWRDDHRSREERPKECAVERCRAAALYDLAAESTDRPTWKEGQLVLDRWPALRLMTGTQILVEEYICGPPDGVRHWQSEKDDGPPHAGWQYIS